jgi:phospholipid/cholesterol/gamma-HCH transport system substrate-binding protein
MFGRPARPIEGYSKTWIGCIAVAVIVAVVGAVLLIGRLSLGQTSYRGEFIQAAQLRPGDQVTVAGIPVGTVSSLALAGDRVVVSFKVDSSVHVGGRTRAAIKMTTLLGRRYLELSPAGAGQPEGRTISSANTAVPYDLEKTLADATTTFEQVDADRVATSMSTLAQGLNGVPEALPQALDNLKSLASIITQRRDQLGTLLKSVDTVTSMIRTQQASLGALVLQGRDLLGDITTRRAAVEKLFASTTTLVNTISRILDDSPSVNSMLASMRDFSQLVAKNDALLRNLLQVMPLMFRNLANATGSGTAVDALPGAGILIDSWMCAISGRAVQFKLLQYFKDCK